MSCFTFSDLVVERVRKVGSDPSLKLLEGRRIVDIAAVIRQARELEDHECRRVEKPGFFQFLKEIRHGAASKLVFQCASCLERRVVTTEGAKPTSEINMGVAWGTTAVGKGYQHIEDLLSVLDVPCPAYGTYHKYEKEVGEVKYIHELN